VDGAVRESVALCLPGVLPVFRRLPLGSLLLWVLTFPASAAMLCLAFVIFVHGLPLGVWPPLPALLLNVVGNAC